MKRKIFCHCGKPLHYQNNQIKRTVAMLIEEFGERMPVQVLGKGTFLVPRHYIALHGLKTETIDTLGFEKQ